MPKALMQLQAVVRTPVSTRGGEFADGRTWSVKEIEVLDSDSNKFTVRVHDGLAVPDGPFSPNSGNIGKSLLMAVLCEWEKNQTVKHTVISVRPEPGKA